MALQLLPSLLVQGKQSPTEMAVGSSIEGAHLQCLPAVFEEVPKRRFACRTLLFLRHLGELPVVDYFSTHGDVVVASRSPGGLLTADAQVALLLQLSEVIGDGVDRQPFAFGDLLRGDFTLG